MRSGASTDFDLVDCNRSIGDPECQYEATGDHGAWQDPLVLFIPPCIGESTLCSGTTSHNLGNLFSATLPVTVAFVESAVGNRHDVRSTEHTRSGMTKYLWHTSALYGGPVSNVAQILG